MDDKQGERTPANIWYNTWTSFTDLIRQYVKIPESVLQLNLKDVDRIHEYCTQTIKTVAVSLVVDDNLYKLRIYLSNIKKIEKLIDNKILDENNLEVALIQVFVHLLEKKDNVEHIIEIPNMIIKYFKNTDKFILEKIFNIAVSHKLLGIVNKLKTHVDLNKFVGDNIKVDQIIKTNSTKLFDYLVVAP
jgi:hypothetical protein